MADQDQTDRWLAWRRSGEGERMQELESNVADAWWDSLTMRQREIYAELQESGRGLIHLHQRILEARLASRRGREKRD